MILREGRGRLGERRVVVRLGRERGGGSVLPAELGDESYG